MKNMVEIIELKNFTYEEDGSMLDIKFCGDETLSPSTYEQLIISVSSQQFSTLRGRILQQQALLILRLRLAVMEGRSLDALSQAVIIMELEKVSPVGLAFFEAETVYRVCNFRRQVRVLEEGILFCSIPVASGWSCWKRSAELSMLINSTTLSNAIDFVKTQSLHEMSGPPACRLKDLFNLCCSLLEFVKTLRSGVWFSEIKDLGVGANEWMLAVNKAIHRPPQTADVFHKSMILPIDGKSLHSSFLSREKSVSEVLEILELCKENCTKLPMYINSHLAEVISSCKAEIEIKKLELKFLYSVLLTPTSLSIDSNSENLTLDDVVQYIQSIPISCSSTIESVEKNLDLDSYLRNVMMKCRTTFTELDHNEELVNLTNRGFPVLIQAKQTLRLILGMFESINNGDFETLNEYQEVLKYMECLTINTANFFDIVKLPGLSPSKDVDSLLRLSDLDMARRFDNKEEIIAELLNSKSPISMKSPFSNPCEPRVDFVSHILNFPLSINLN
jgi:hypothetical protein